jgi:hypothetical protein
VAGSDLLDVTTAPGGTTWAVGAAGPGGALQALVEEMTASGWVSVPAATPADSLLESVSAVSADDIWAVGYYSASGKAVPLLEHWDGTAWSQVTSPPLNGELRGVFAVGPSDVWAVGEQSAGNVYATLTEHWDGSTWSVIPSPNVGQQNNWFNAVAGDASSSVWAVGWHGNSNHTLAEHWDGTAWQIVPTPSPSSGLNVLQDVADLSQSDVWAVGYSGSGVRSTLAEHWDGSTWQAVTTPNAASRTNQLIGVAALSPGDIWAVGEYYKGGGWKALAENWDGSSWATTTMPDELTGNEVSAVTVLADGSAWSVGDSYPAGGSAQAVTRQICPAELTDSGFAAAKITDPSWQSVTWYTSPLGTSDHTVTDAAGLGLFDSGPLPAGSSYPYTFFASGTYPVTDAATGTTQTVKVPLRATPSSGTASTTFSVKWASETAPSGYVYDVQLEPPNSAQYTPFATGVSADSGSFSPVSGAGIYRFEARLRNISNGAYSLWSPPRSISVTTG